MSAPFQAEVSHPAAMRAEPEEPEVPEFLANMPDQELQTYMARRFGITDIRRQDLPEILRDLGGQAQTSLQVFEYQVSKSLGGRVRI